MDNILKSKAAKNYVKWAQVVGSYAESKLAIPQSIQNEHDNALEKYRTYLDVNNIKMPKSLWRYKHADKHTWFFSNLIVKDGKYKGEIENVLFNPKGSSYERKQRK